MAGFNELGEHSLNDLLSARLNMLGGAPSPACMPEIGPTLVLESERPEWGYWKNEFWFGGRCTAGALAANRAAIWIPPRPGFITVLTSFTNRTVNTSTIGWRTTQPNFSASFAIGNGVNLDNRAPVTATAFLFGNAPVANFGFDNAGAAFWAITLPTAQPNEVRMPPIVLRPGGAGVLLLATADNQAIDYNIFGYSRPIVPNEQLG